MNDYVSHFLGVRKLSRFRCSVVISSVSLIEMIYRSGRMEDNLLKNLVAIAALPNVKYVAFPLLTFEGQGVECLVCG